MREGRQRSGNPLAIKQAPTMSIPVFSRLPKKERCNPVQINSRFLNLGKLIEKLNHQIILPVQTENGVLYDS